MSAEIRELTLSIFVGILGCDGGTGGTGPTPPPSTPPVIASPTISADGFTFRDSMNRSYTCVIEVPGVYFDYPTNVDLYGQRVFLQNRNLGTDGFFTLLTAREPIIYLDLSIVSRRPVPAQVYVFAHECGHTNVADWQLIVSERTMELSADCWAATRITAQRLLTNSDWQTLKEFFLSVPPATPSRPSGQERWDQMVQCGAPNV